MKDNLNKIKNKEKMIKKKMLKYLNLKNNQEIKVIIMKTKDINGEVIKNNIDLINKINLLLNLLTITL